MSLCQRLSLVWKNLSLNIACLVLLLPLPCCLHLLQVGKFYELYHMDAVIGIKELGLVAMKVCTNALSSECLSWTIMPRIAWHWNAWSQLVSLANQTKLLLEMFSFFNDKVWCCKKIPGSHAPNGTHISELQGSLIVHSHCVHLFNVGCCFIPHTFHHRSASHLCSCPLFVFVRAHTVTLGFQRLDTVDTQTSWCRKATGKLRLWASMVVVLDIPNKVTETCRRESIHCAAKLACCWKYWGLITVVGDHLPLSWLFSNTCLLYLLIWLLPKHARSKINWWWPEHSFPSDFLRPNP